MNPVIEAMKNRRSVRHYESKPLPRDVVNTIIEAGNQAPTAANRQPWRFVVVEENKFKKKLSQIALPTYRKWLEGGLPLTNRRISYDEERRKSDREYDPVYYSAPVILFVIGTNTDDCPMVCQNIMLAAYSLGLGSCWVGFGKMGTENEEVRKALELKENEKIFGPILLGYPKGGFPEPPIKKEPLIKWI